jgi:molybdopterin synthase catalytic subunit
MPDSNVWTAITSDPLPVEEARRWVTTPSSGGVVVFTGVVRDHAEGREGVTGLTYEAYESAAQERLDEIARSALATWPLGRVALLHRVGDVELGEPTVVVAVASAHRAEAFEAARWCIDTLKETVPIWKREHWRDGSGWSTCDHEVRQVGTGAATGAGVEQ